MKDKSFLALFIGLWLLTYNIYPVAILPVSLAARAAVFMALLLYFSLNAIFLSSWLKQGVSQQGGLPAQKGAWQLLKDTPFLAAALCLFIGLQFYPATFPVLTLGDEAYHLHVPARMAHIFIPSCLKGILFFLIAGIWLMYFMARRRKLSLWPVYLGLLYSASFSAFIFMSKMPFSPGLVRYPPLGKILYLFLFSLFGVNEIWPRLLEMSFMVLAGLYLYRLIALYKDKSRAQLGFVIFLFSPLVFLYGHLAYLTGGVLFFTLAAFYYLLRYLKFSAFRDLIYSVWLLNAGFLYKESLIILIPVAFLILFLQGGGSKPERLIPATWLMFVPVLPWLLINKLFVWRSYEFAPGNWVSLKSALFLFSSLRDCFGAAFFMVILFSFIRACLKRKKDILDKAMLIMFLGQYIFWTSDAWLERMSFRNTITLLAPLCLFCADFIYRILSRLRRQGWCPGISYILIFYLALGSTVVSWPKEALTFTSYIRHKDEAALRASALEFYYFPYPALFAFLKEDNLPQGKGILYPDRYAPLSFYNYKYNLSVEWAQDLAAPLTDTAQLEHLIAGGDFDYLVLDNGPACAGLYEKTRDAPPKGLRLIKEFFFGESRLALYKIGSV